MDRRTLLTSAAALLAGQQLHCPEWISRAEAQNADAGRTGNKYQGRVRGVTLGTYGATDATGWSVFTNPLHVYYVSHTQGNNSNRGTFISPFKPIRKAYDTLKATGTVPGPGRGTR